MLIVTEQMRVNLANRANDIFKEDGQVLMAHLPVGGAAGVATKQDLMLTKQDLELTMSKALHRQTWSLFGLFFAMNSVFLAISRWG